MNYHYHYTIIFKDTGEKFEQDSNEFYTESWLAQFAFNAHRPVYAEDIKYISKFCYIDKKLIEFCEEDTELWQDLIQKTRQEMEFEIKGYKEIAELF